jgi:hypothetical protein
MHYPLEPRHPYETVPELMERNSKGSDDVLKTVVMVTTTKAVDVP